MLLAALMLTGALSGCGGSSSSDSQASGNDSGVSGAITVISREDGSGTRGAFIELTGVEEKNDAGEKIDNTTADAEIANKTDVVLTSVAGNEKAIGYISLGALNDTVKAVKVDGAEWFNEVYTDSKLANTAGYFCFGGINTASVTIEKTGKAVVPDPEPEPTYDVVDVTELLSDTKNWTTGWNKALTFENGSVTADGDLSSTYSVGGYNGKTYKNTIFRFKYTRTRYADDGYDGFTLGSGPDNVYWGAGGIYVDFNKDSAVLRCIGKDKQAVFVTTEVPSLNDGQSYNIEFGIIDVNESTVKVLLKINDKAYFEKELTSSDFVGEEFYFGIIAVKSKATISKPDAK